ncbi:MAG: hypothetical protein QY325_04235 [Flavobacteriales bacterium]|nr:MAG: hypothetical protein QY325_04235 [Flavobacteriales bacterium]
MSITTDINTLAAIAAICTTCVAIVLVRTSYQLARLRHAAASAAQWDRLQRDVVQEVINRNRPVQVSADGITINPK